METKMEKSMHLVLSIGSLMCKSVSQRLKDFMFLRIIRLELG